MGVTPASQCDLKEQHALIVFLVWCRWITKRGGKLYVKQYLPDINGNTHSNSSFKVVKKEKKKKQKNQPFW